MAKFLFHKNIKFCEIKSGVFRLTIAPVVRDHAGSKNKRGKCSSVFRFIFNLQKKIIEI
jgi:hypothetical protein